MAYLGDDGRLGDVTDEDVERAGRGQRGPLEAGWYRCALIEDEVQTKSWGIGLNMQFQIISGDHENQRIFDYLCVRHSTSEQAESIARAKLKSFAIAAGAKNPDDVRDTAPLYGKPVMIKVYREQQDDPKYADEDGCKAKPGVFVSVAKWKEDHCDEYMPGVAKKEAPPAVETAAAPPPNNSPPAAAHDDDIPF